MKILYLTPNFKAYTASSYQLNTIAALKRKINIILWGPGFDNFDPRLELKDVVKKFKFNDSDALCIGHGWLSDSNSTTIKMNKDSYKWLSKKKDIIDEKKLEYCRSYNYDDFKGKKIIILNKEYVNLKEKLEFIKRINFSFVLSHNPHYQKYQLYTGKKFYFWPHAVNALKNRKLDFEKRKYDLYFSGITKNPFLQHILSERKKDLRVRIQNFIFYNYKGINFFKKKKYKNYKIFWNAFTGNKLIDKFKNIIGQYKLYDEEDYFNNYFQSKVVLSTLSPADIISPRYFETMISGAICLCEESDLYKDILVPYENYIPFRKDLSDFHEKFKLCIESNEIQKKILKNSYEFVINNHTYDVRAQQLIDYLKNE